MIKFFFSRCIDHLSSKLQRLETIHTVLSIDLYISYSVVFRLPQEMSNWDQLYDLKPLLHTPPKNPISKQHSYLSCKSHKRYDSDSSSISSPEGEEDIDNFTWWDLLDHEEEAIVRYINFLRGHLTKGLGLEQREEPEVVMTRIESKSMLQVQGTTRC
jgi:hypothetical protein